MKAFIGLLIMQLLSAIPAAVVAFLWPRNILLPVITYAVVLTAIGALLIVIAERSRNDG